jgi:hypothetical protein
MNQAEEKRAVLGPGDLIPSFEGQAVDGRRLRYEELWQRRNLVLFVLSAAARAEALSDLAAVEAGLSKLQPDDTTLVICDHTIAGVPLDAVVVADRWGEIAYVHELKPNREEWPSRDEILEWVEFIRIKCPECPP